MNLGQAVLQIKKLAAVRGLVLSVSLIDLNDFAGMEISCGSNMQGQDPAFAGPIWCSAVAQNLRAQ